MGSGMRVVVNARSGRRGSRQKLNEIRAALSRYRLDVEIRPARSGRRIAEAVAAGVGVGFDTIVGGGDGTLGAAAAHLAETGRERLPGPYCFRRRSGARRVLAPPPP